MYRHFIKPFFDFVSALIILIISSPVCLLTILLLLLSAKGKVWFIQQRPGRHGRPFKLIKFRTMNDTRNEKGALLSDEVRLTAIGKFIRKTSIDELPQLLNVLKGDMSIVGPRPLLMEYLPLYNATQQRRHEVKPGITGWAQVNGRNAISWQEKFEFDVWYVNNLSFLLDIKILLHTLLKVFRAEGINAADAATMEKFEGN